MTTGPATAPRWEWLARAVLVAAAGALAAAVLAGSALLWRDIATGAERAGVDYLALYTGGRLFRTAPERLYDLSAQREVERGIVAPDTLAEDLLPFPYPPHAAAVLSLLDPLGFAGSYAAAGLIGVALLVAALAAIVRRAPLSRAGAPWLLLAAVVSLPVSFTIVQGQVSTLVLLLLALHVFDARDGHAVRAGLWLGLLAFKPQLAVLPALLLARRRQWLALATFGATAALTWLVVLPRVGLGAVAGYAEVLRALSGASDTLGVHPDRMFHLRALALAALPDAWAPALAVLASVIVGGLLLWPPPRGRLSPRGTPWHWAALAPAILLVVPHVNLHDLTLLVLSVGLSLSPYRDRVPLGTAAAAVGLMALPTVLVVVGGADPPIGAVAVVPAAMLGAFAALLARHASWVRAEGD